MNRIKEWKYMCDDHAMHWFRYNSTKRRIFVDFQYDNDVDNDENNDDIVHFNDNNLMTNVLKPEA